MAMPRLTPTRGAVMAGPEGPWGRIEAPGAARLRRLAVALTVRSIRIGRPLWMGCPGRNPRPPHSLA